MRNENLFLDWTAWAFNSFNLEVDVHRKDKSQLPLNSHTLYSRRKYYCYHQNAKIFLAPFRNVHSKSCRS